MPNYPPIKNRYIIENIIAQGGQAVICAARDTHLEGKRLAVKCYDLRKPGAKDAAGTERKILSTYSHHCIPKMYDEDTNGFVYFIIMDLIEGTTLSQLAEGKQMSPAVISDCIQKISDLLNYFHTHPTLPIVYGDLKPENIIRSKDGRWALVDFASSIFMDASRQGQSRKLGTPGFAAPELAAGMTVTPAADIYSIGVLAHYLEKGSIPGCDGDLESKSAIKRAISQDPTKRFKCVDEFINALKNEDVKKQEETRKCAICGYSYGAALRECPRCQAVYGEKGMKLKVPWELPPIQSTITPLVNTGLFKALEKLQFADASWKPLRDKAEELSEVKGFKELITVSRMRIELYKHQEESIRRFLNDFHGNGILADEVGLGKTIEAGVIIAEMLERKLVRRVLIVAPNHLVSQWIEDMYEKIGLRVLNHNAIDAPSSQIVIVPFTSFRVSTNSHLFENNNYDMVVMDEAHNLITSKGVSTGWYVLSSMKRRYTVLMSATPIKRRITDLYHLVTLIRPGEFKNFSDFERLYSDPGNPYGVKNTRQLINILSGMVIRNKRQAIAKSWPSKESYPIVLRQEQKFQKLVEILQKNSQTLSIIFASDPSIQQTIVQYLRDYRSHIQNRRVLHLKGDRVKKSELIRDFKQSGNGILVADKSSSEGRNLQFCHVVVNFDIPGDPIEIEQRIGRVYRIGQESNVHIYNLAAKDTLEEFLLELYDKHLKLFSLWVGEIYDVIGHLEKEETIPVKSKKLWSMSKTPAEFKQKWNAYISSIIKATETEQTEDEERSKILNQLFG